MRFHQLCGCVREVNSPPICLCLPQQHVAHRRKSRGFGHISPGDAAIVKRKKDVLRTNSQHVLSEQHIIGHTCQHNIVDGLLAALCSPYEAFFRKIQVPIVAYLESLRLREQSLKENKILTSDEENQKGGRGHSSTHFLFS